MRIKREYVAFVASLVRARLCNLRVPLSVGIHVTGRCNFRCVYCYGSYGAPKTSEFTTEQLLSLITDVHRAGTRWITLTGGEPLIRNDLETIVDAIKKLKMLCSLNTNGSLIENRMAVIRKIDFITVSLDGDEAAHDRNRGPGTYQQAMRGMQCLKAINKPFDAVAVLTRHSLPSIDYLLDLADSMRFLIEFNFLQDQAGHAGNPCPEALTDDEIRTALNLILERKKQNRPVYYSAASRRYALRWPVSYARKIIFEQIPGFKPHRCYLGQLMCHIDADGLVYPCIQLAGNFPALNVLEHGFAKAWENLAGNKRCVACYAVCYAEFNAVYNLSPAAWLNIVQQFIRKRM